MKFKLINLNMKILEDDKLINELIIKNRIFCGIRVCK